MKRILLVGLLALAAPRGAQAQPHPDTVIIGVRDTAAHLHRSREGNGPDKPVRRVIRDQQNLDEVWRMLTSRMRVPRIDFEDQDVLVAAFGVDGYIGPTINIDTVLTRDAERIAIVRVTDVAERCLLAAAYSYPIDIVVVPRDSTRTTRFVERKTRLRGCRPSPPTIIRYDRP